jgi:molybdopterin molybdotransferase
LLRYVFYTSPYCSTCGLTLVRLKGFQKLTSTDEALRIWLLNLPVQKRKTVEVPLQKALGRILVEDIFAQEDLPRFDKSAVDGYALVAKSTTGATQFKPATLQVTEAGEITSKQAVQIWTGNPIPEGADAVVMIENTMRHDGELEVWLPLVPGENVSKKGEDLQKGECAAKAGSRLNPYHLGLLAALGYTQIEVVEKPRIAIIATGGELAKAGTIRKENQIFESNQTMLSAMCREFGAEPVSFGIAKDDIDEIAEKVRLGLQKCDAIITSGGTSVGGHDLVPDAVNKVGKPGVVVHGIAVRPGMPTAVAVVENKPVMILSGNPVAAIIGFEVFARPLLSRMLGMSKEEPRPTLKAVMTRKIATALGRKNYVRVRVTQKNDEFYAEPVSTRGSGAISTMTRSNGFVVVPENREGVKEGELVTVRLFGPVEEVEEHV